MFDTNTMALNSQYITSEAINKQLIIEFQLLFKKYFIIMLNKAANKGSASFEDEEKIRQYHTRMRQILLHDPRIFPILFWHIVLISGCNMAVIDEYPYEEFESTTIALKTFLYHRELIAAETTPLLQQEIQKIELSSEDIAEINSVTKKLADIFDGLVKRPANFIPQQPAPQLSSVCKGLDIAKLIAAPFSCINAASGGMFLAQYLGITNPIGIYLAGGATAAATLLSFIVACPPDPWSPDPAIRARTSKCAMAGNYAFSFFESFACAIPAGLHGNLLAEAILPGTGLYAGLIFGTASSLANTILNSDVKQPMYALYRLLKDYLRFCPPRLRHTFIARLSGQALLASFSIASYIAATIELFKRFGASPSLAIGCGIPAGLLLNISQFFWLFEAGGNRLNCTIRNFYPTEMYSAITSSDQPGKMTAKYSIKLVMLLMIILNYGVAAYGGQLLPFLASWLGLPELPNSDSSIGNSTITEYPIESNQGMDYIFYIALHLAGAIAGILPGIVGTQVIGKVPKTFKKLLFK